MRKYDSITKYRDKVFNCNAKFKANDCERALFTEEFERMIDEFEEELGEIESITIVFKR